MNAESVMRIVNEHPLDEIYKITRECFAVLPLNDFPVSRCSLLYEEAIVRVFGRCFLVVRREITHHAEEHDS